MENMTVVEGKHHVISVCADKFSDWMRTRGGIVIWGCLDLGNAGQTWSGPRNTADGTPSTKPHWSATTEPIRVITDSDEIMVDIPREVTRFHIALKQSGMTIRLTDGSDRKVKKAMKKAGDGAWYEFDYSTQEAVIYLSSDSMSLTEWMKTH